MGKHARPYRAGRELARLSSGESGGKGKHVRRVPSPIPNYSAYPGGIAWEFPLLEIPIESRLRRIGNHIFGPPVA